VTTLKASTAQVKSYIERQKNGTLANGVYIEIGKSVAEIKAKRELLRDLAPTAQRLAKGGISLQPVENLQGIKIGSQYRAKGPVETYKNAWPHYIYVAFKNLIADARNASSSAGLVIQYDGNSSRSSAPRAGGMVDCSDTAHGRRMNGCSGLRSASPSMLSRFSSGWCCRWHARRTGAFTKQGMLGAYYALGFQRTP
jgi:hypothetical protein